MIIGVCGVPHSREQPFTLKSDLLYQGGQIGPVLFSCWLAVIMLVIKGFPFIPHA